MSDFTRPLVCRAWRSRRLSLSALLVSATFAIIPPSVHAQVADEESSAVSIVAVPDSPLGRANAKPVGADSKLNSVLELYRGDTAPLSVYLEQAIGDMRTGGADEAEIARYVRSVIQDIEAYRSVLNDHRASAVQDRPGFDEIQRAMHERGYGALRPGSVPLTSSRLPAVTSGSAGPAASIDASSIASASPARPFAQTAFGALGGSQASFRAQLMADNQALQRGEISGEQYRQRRIEALQARQQERRDRVRQRREVLQSRLRERSPGAYQAGAPQVAAPQAGAPQAGAPQAGAPQAGASHSKASTRRP